MFVLSELCELFQLTKDDPIRNFDCDSKDLNDFFCNDALDYQKELLGQTFFFRLKETGKIVCAFTLSNDSIKVDDLPGSRRKKVRQDIPFQKQMKSYPATLIGRLGVSKDFTRKKIGTQVLDFIKSFCITEDVNRCRFLLVDSYNTPDAIGFYSHESNGFLTVFSTELQEKEYYKIDNDAILHSRFMYFDLMKWIEKLKI